MAAERRGTSAVFLHWLGLRAAVNTPQLVGLDDVMGERVERWALRSYDLERDWRGE